MRITGIEPISPAWKADNLPLIYIRIFYIDGFPEKNEKQKKVICNSFHEFLNRKVKEVEIEDVRFDGQRT